MTRVSAAAVLATILATCACNEAPRANSPAPRTVAARQTFVWLGAEGVDEETAREAFRLAAHKLPMKTKFVKREAGDEG